MIDVDADCADSDCAPYVCESDGIACDDRCTGDSQCADGFVCDQDTAVCEPTGCEPIDDGPVPLTGLPPTISEFEIAVGGGEIPSTVPRAQEQFLVLIGRAEGLGFARFNVNGDIVDDPADENLGLVRLAEPNEAFLPYNPTLRYFPIGLDETPVYNPRFAMSWRVAASEWDEVHSATFIIDPISAPQVRRTMQEESRTEIWDLDVRRSPSGLFHAWRFKVGQSSGVRILASDEVGAVEDDSATPAQITPDERTAVGAAVTRVGDTFYTAYSTAGGGQRNLVALATDETTEGVGALRIRADQFATDFEIRGLQSVQSTVAGGFVWVERTGGEDSAYMVVVDETTNSVLSPDATASVTPREIAVEFGDLALIQASDDPDGFIVAWLGSRAGRFDLWVQRYGDDGQPRFTALPASGGGGIRIDAYRVARTATGIAVVWLTEGEGTEPDQLYLRRYRCEDTQ
ncbi:MAG: hypothetical protein ACJAYU_005230 [Bradymonadia bacterium]